MSLEEKEVAWLRTHILPKILENGSFVNNYNPANKSAFRINNISIEIIGAAEAFMLTTCYRAVISFEFEDVSDTHKLVIKKTPTVPQEIYNAVNFEALFSNEIEFYTRILPEIEKVTSKPLRAPRYYYSEKQHCSAAIVLGDFAADGWRVAKQRYNLSLEHILLAVKYIANYHANGFVLKTKNRALFDGLTSNLKDSRFANDEIHHTYAVCLKASIERAIKATRQYEPQVDEEFLLKFNRLTASYVSYGRQRLAPKEPLATLCHADYLRNNVAYKFQDDAAEVPIDIIMFDFQTLRYTSPMVDFSLFIALSAFAEIRQKHFNEIFDAYASTLAEAYVQATGQPLPDYLSRDALLKEHIRFLPYTIYVSASFLMKLVDPENISTEEMLNREIPDEEIIAETMTRGGEIVNRELAHQVRELYDLSSLHGVDFTEGINY